MAKRTVLLTSTADLKEDPKNPRAITPEELEALKGSTKRFGDISGIVWNKRTGQLVTGHQRLKSLREQHGGDLSIEMDEPRKRFFILIPGAEPFAGRLVDWPLTLQRAANIAANSEYLTGSFTDALQPQLADLRATDADLFEALRFEELTVSFESETAPGAGTPDEIPQAPARPTTKLGDLYHLGAHRLLCGDSTKTQNVDRLMDGKKADLVHTDPPYGVSYVSQSGAWEMIKNDDKTRDELVKKVLLPAFQQAFRVSKGDAAFYIWHASSTREDFVYAMKMAGLLEKQYLIWVKPQMVLGHADYHWSHEPCFYAEKDGQHATFYGDRTQTTIWRATLKKAAEMVTTIGKGILVMDGQGNKVYIAPTEPKGKKIRAVRIVPGRKLSISSETSTGDAWEIDRETQTEHPTQKPVELARRAIENSSAAGELVLDLFGGSGTTLLAAEATGRICHMMESDPTFCDVIVARWELYTGEKATLQKRGK